jgi:hypothetical protein
MPTSIIIDDDTPILVELKPRPRERDVAKSEDLLRRSLESINNAMATIYTMSQRVAYTVRSIPISERPDKVEVEFGLKLTTDANAFVVAASVDAQVNVKLTRERKGDDSQEYSSD